MLTRVKTNPTRSKGGPPTTGQHFENFALEYLEARGLRLVERNFHCPLGEIDLIMYDGNTLVFVEVKFRQRSHYGESAEQVTHRKKQKLINSALLYLSRHAQYANVPCRFDVVGISPGQGSAAAVNWISNALEIV
jgi:putative endonuclease